MREITLTGILLLFSLSAASAEDWTIGERIYHNVIVDEVDADKVQITFDGTDSRWLALADLPPALQKRYNYDPVKAQADAQQKAYAEWQKQYAIKAQAIAEKGVTYPRGRVTSVIQLDNQGTTALLVSVYGLEDYSSGTVIMVVGLDGQYADGDWIPWGHGTPYYYGGITHYTSVMGADVTCRIYSPSLDLAVANLLSQAEAQAQAQSQ